MAMFRIDIMAMFRIDIMAMFGLDDIAKNERPLHDGSKVPDTLNPSVVAHMGGA